MSTSKKKKGNIKIPTMSDHILTPHDLLEKASFTTIVTALPLISGAYMRDEHIDLLFHEQMLKGKHEETKTALQKKEGEQDMWRRMESDAGKRMISAKEYPYDNVKKDEKGKKKSKKPLTDDERVVRERRVQEALLDMKRASNACTLYEKSLVIARDLEWSLGSQIKAHEKVCDKQLSTHYRKQSIALHPDRNGEHLRGEFDQFKIFMDVLRVGEKRTQYFGQMLKVQKTMPQYTAHGHEVWMKSNTEQEDEELNEELTAVVKDDAAEEAGEKKATKPKPKTGGMRLDLGGQSMMPRIPCVLYFVGDHHAKILCTIPTGFHANFPVTLNYEVLGPDGMVRYKDTFGGVDVMQYEAIVDLEDWGEYQFRFAISTQSHTGQWCKLLDIIHDDPKNIDETAELKRIGVIVKTRSDTMVVAMRRSEKVLDGRAMQDPDKVRLVMDDLHKAVVRCTNITNVFQKMKGAAYDADLQKVFIQCENGQKMLKFIEEKYLKKEKKDVNRAFVRFIAEMLETHRFDEWLSDTLIGKTDIINCCEGGSMNRLFQMLAESKKGKLEITSFVIEAAATRLDWFTDSQIKKLNDAADVLRAEEEELEDAEAREDEAEELRREKDLELQRKSAEQRAAPPPPEPADVPGYIEYKGRVVALTGMSESVMNGRTGVVQPYDLGEDQWAVKLTVPVNGYKSAVTVYTHQLRMLNNKEIQKAAADQEKFLARESARLTEEDARKERAQERKDEELALKLVQQSIKRDNLGVDLEPVAPPSTKRAKAPATARPRVSGTIKEFGKGKGYIKYGNKQKIFFVFKEVVVPEEFESMKAFARKSKLQTQLVKGEPVTFEIGMFTNETKGEDNEVACNVEITQFFTAAPQAPAAQPRAAPAMTPVSSANGAWANVAAKPVPKPVPLPAPAAAPTQADYLSDKEFAALNLATMEKAKPPSPAPPGFGAPSTSVSTSIGGPSITPPPTGYSMPFSETFGIIGGSQTLGGISSNAFGTSLSSGILGDYSLGGSLGGGSLGGGSLGGGSLGGGSLGSGPLGGGSLGGALSPSYQDVGLSDLNVGSTPFVAPTLTMSGLPLGSTIVDLSLSTSLSMGAEAVRGCTKLRKFAMAYLGQKLVAQVRSLQQSAINVDGRFTYFPFLRLGSPQQDVFRGYSTTGTMKQCAVKRLSKASHNMQEVDILRKIAHENIVAVEDFANASVEFFYIALELCHGDLEQLIEPSPSAARRETMELLPRPLSNAALKKDIVSQILHAVAFLHQKDVAHRDLKPTNVLFVERNKQIIVKVADFGISKALDDSVTSYTMTSNAMAGSKGFQAQELVQLKLGELENQAWRPTKEDFKRADIFSFGLVAYYVLTGGLHPYSNPDPRRVKRIGDRETRIADGEAPNLNPITDSEEKHFFQTTLNHKAAIRPSADALYGRFGPKHPFFFTPAMRMNVVGAAERICKSNVNLGRSSGLDLLEKICASNLNWKEHFEDVWERDGSMVLPSGESMTYKRNGRDLIRFARNMKEHYHEYGIMSKLKTSVISAGGGATQDEAICRWLQVRTPLLWILLFEDKVGLE